MVETEKFLKFGHGLLRWPKMASFFFYSVFIGRENAIFNRIKDVFADIIKEAAIFLGVSYTY